MSFTDAERDAFIEGYVGCMLWANAYEWHPVSGELEPKDANYEGYGFTDAAMFRIEEVCDDFMRQAEPMLRATIVGRDMSYHGHDLALTQNRHGAGFWDRGYPHVLGQALTEAAHAMGEASAYVNADGSVDYEG